MLKLSLTTLLLSLFLTQATLATPVKILPLGDSITAGIGPDAPEDALPSYRRDLWHMLKNSGYDVNFLGSKHTYTDVEISPEIKDFDPDFEGHPSITAAQINTDTESGYNISDLMRDGNYIPDVVLVHLGTNDILNSISNKTPLETRTAIEGIVTQLQAKNPNVVVLIAKIIPVYNYDSPPIEIAKPLNDLLTQIWADSLSTAHSIIKIVDLYTDYPKTKAYWDEYMIHPSATGEAYMASKWFDTLRKLAIMKENQTKTPSPKPPITYGLTLLLDASDVNADGILDSIDAISEKHHLTTWLDKSGKGNHVTQVLDMGSPTRLANKLHKRAVVYFNETGLKTDNSNQITSNKNYTKFAVFKFDTNSDKLSANHLISSITTHGDSGTSLWGAGKNAISAQHDDSHTDFISSDIQSIEAVDVQKEKESGYHIAALRYSPTKEGNLLKLDGASKETNNEEHPHKSAMTTIGYGGGSNANGKFHLKGEIAEAIIYDRALSDPEIESIESYLSKKWGLNLLTLEEIALLAIVEDIAGNTDKRPASSKQINLIIGTSIAKEETDYCIELSKGTYKDRASPTKDELINIIEKVNSAQTKNTGGGTNSPSLLLLSILLYRRFFKQHKFRESFKMQ